MVRARGARGSGFVWTFIFGPLGLLIIVFLKDLKPRAVALFLYQDKHGEVHGPVPLEQLAAMRALPAESRTVSGNTLVCMQGRTDWFQLQEWMNHHG